MSHDMTETKVCTYCKETKLKYVDFALVKKKNRPNPQVRPQCRLCRSKVEMERRNKDEANREAYLNRLKQWRENNKEKITNYHMEQRDANLERFKQYREENGEKIKLYKKTYQQKPENKAKRNEKDKQRRKDDETFRIMANIRTRIHNVLKQNKTDKTDKLLGCNKTQLHSWLSYQLYDDLTWVNYADVWQIDHVVPLAFFDMTDKRHQLLAFNWSNLRPLYADENSSKNDSIVETHIRNHIKTVDKFISLNSGYHVSNETCWCQRFKASEGKNSQDERDFTSFLKWIISNDSII